MWVAAHCSFSSEFIGRRFLRTYSPISILIEKENFEIVSGEELSSEDIFPVDFILPNGSERHNYEAVVNIVPKNRNTAEKMMRIVLDIEANTVHLKEDKSNEQYTLTTKEQDLLLIDKRVELPTIDEEKEPTTWIHDKY